MRSIVLLLSSSFALLFLLSNGAVAFAPQNKATSRAVFSRSSLGSSSSREEEIAKLEEQLRKLKKEQQESSSDTRPESSLSGEINQVEQRILEKVQGKDIFLSEQDLYDGNIVQDQESQGGGNILQSILTAVIAVVFLGAFSQIPIGQDSFSKYSANSGPTTSRTIDLGDLNTDAPRPWENERRAIIYDQMYNLQAMNARI